MRESVMTLWIACTAGVAIAGPPPTLEPLPLVEGQAKELGGVHWERGFDRASVSARASGKPLLVLFDEVPGCHTCVSFGTDVLTDALLVEAAETLFVPVAVFNNVPGADAETLASFGEPAWNNPVVRVVDAATRKDIGARVGDDYSVGAVASSMAAGLKAAGRTVPGYLRLLAEGTPERTEKAVFAMYCFWEGEAKLGGLDGVVATSAGFLDGKECVEVEFDPGRLRFKDLLIAAERMDCLHGVYTTTDAQQTEARLRVGSLARRASTAMKVSASDTKFKLSNSEFGAVPMTGTQACRVNAALGAGGDGKRFLSARQLEKLRAE